MDMLGMYSMHNILVFKIYMMSIPQTNFPISTHVVDDSLINIIVRQLGAVFVSSRWLHVCDTLYSSI